MVTFVKSCKKVRRCVVSVLSLDMLYLKVVAAVNSWLKNTVECVQKACPADSDWWSSEGRAFQGGKGRCSIERDLSFSFKYLGQFYSQLMLSMNEYWSISRNRV